MAHAFPDALFAHFCPSPYGLKLVSLIEKLNPLKRGREERRRGGEGGEGRGGEGRRRRGEGERRRGGEEERKGGEERRGVFGFHRFHEVPCGV